MIFDFELDPVVNFENLYLEATRSIPDANAMSLATVDSMNKPSVRIVLFKGLVDGGFCFFTNYGGRKSVEIEKNNHVSLAFFWPQLQQQIRIEGRAQKISREESESYFRTRPRLSQIGAWASSQSKKVPSLQYLQNKLEEFEFKFKNQEVPCPPNWGGFTVLPHYFEFWFGREGRLHDRFVYERPAQPTTSGATHSWEKYLLSP